MFPGNAMACDKASTRGNGRHTGYVPILATTLCGSDRSYTGAGNKDCTEINSPCLIFPKSWNSGKDKARQWRRKLLLEIICCDVNRPPCKPPFSSLPKEWKKKFNFIDASAWSKLCIQWLPKTPSQVCAPGVWKSPTRSKCHRWRSHFPHRLAHASTSAEAKPTWQCEALDSSVSFLNDIGANEKLCVK